MTTREELEKLLASDAKGPPVHIRPDGSIGEPESWAGRAYRLCDQLRSHLSVQPALVGRPGWSGTLPRPRLRSDGIPTRIDLQHMTGAELAIMDAIGVVERAGASPALTEAVTLLAKARDRVADHVEGIE